MAKASMKIGDIFSTNNYGKCRVVEYNNAKDVVVEFIDTGYRVKCGSSDLRNGEVKDRLKPSAYGVGFIGDGPYKATVGGKNTAPYCAWNNMVKRCYCPKYQDMYPTYIGCSVANEWHDFQVFSSWFDEHYVAGWELDKDLLVHGNKIYSPDTCVFVPNEINSLLVDRAALRGALPVGICWDKRSNKYKAYCCYGSGTKKHLGYYTDIQSAFDAYVEFKRKVVKQRLEGYAGNGLSFDLCCKIYDKAVLQLIEEATRFGLNNHQDYLST